MSKNAPLSRIEQAGYRSLLRDVVLVTDNKITAYADLKLVLLLRGDPRFKEGIFHGLHPNVGKPRTEFRSHTNEFGDGSGSLQVVINTRDGFMECDCDGWSPYSDLLGIVMHLGKEVLWPKLKGWFSA